MPANPTGKEVAATPSPHVLKGYTDLLHELQKVLGNMGRDERRKSAEFQELMAQYKSLGTDLHEARKRVVAAQPPRPAVAMPGQATRQVSALGNVRQPTSPSSLPFRMGGGSPSLNSTAQAYGRMQAGYRPQPVPAAPAAIQPPAAATTAPAPVGEHTEAADTAAAAPRPVLPAVSIAPLPGLPLAMPRFMSSLGPAGSRAINKGPEVKRLQELLLFLGYDLKATESFDVQTFRAVQELQKVQHLTVNGLVGLEMRTFLNKLVTG